MSKAVGIPLTLLCSALYPRSVFSGSSTCRQWKVVEEPEKDTCEMKNFFANQSLYLVVTRQSSTKRFGLSMEISKDLPGNPVVSLCRKSQTN